MRNSISLVIFALFAALTIAQAAADIDDYKNNKFTGKMDNIGPLATPTRDGRMSKHIKATTVYVDEYGTIGDGSPHTLASEGYTLVTAAERWPGVTFSNVSTQYVDWAALQYAVNIAESEKRDLRLGGKSYVTNETIVSTGTSKIYGSGRDATNVRGDFNGAIFQFLGTRPTIQDMTIRKHTTPVKGDGSIGVSIGDATHEVRTASLERLRIDPVDIGIQLEASAYASITNNTIGHFTYGITIQNLVEDDSGDNFIQDNQISKSSSATDTPVSAIYQIDGGGTRVLNNKIFNADYAFIYDAENGSGTTIVEITGNSFELQKIGNIWMKDTGTGVFRYAKILGNQLSLYSGTGDGITMEGIPQVDISHNQLTGNLAGGNTGIKLINCDNFVVTHNNLDTFTTGVSIDSASGSGEVSLGTHVGVTTDYVNNSASTVVNSGYGTDSDFGIGTLEPSFPLHVQKEWPAPSVLNINLASDSYGDNSRHILRRANGTVATPTATLSGNAIGTISFRGHDGTNFFGASAAGIAAIAAENHSTTNQGTSLGFYTTPIGAVATGADLAMSVGADKSLTVQSTVKSAAGGFIFPDATTQTTAAKPVCTVTDGAIQFNSAGDLSCNGQLYTLGSGTLYANDLFLSASDPALFTDDYTTTGLKTAPSSTIFKGLSDRIPTITATHIPSMNAAGTAYESSGWNRTSSGIGFGETATLPITIYSTTAAPSIRLRDEVTTAAGGGLFLGYHNNASNALPNATDVLAGLVGGYFDGATTRNVGSIVVTADTGIATGAAGRFGKLSFRTANGGAPAEKLSIAANGLMTNANGGGWPFGHQYFNDLAGITIAVAVSNTWYEIDGAGTTFTAGQLKNITQSDHYLVATTAGYYKVDYCVSIDTTNPGDEIAATVAVNGTADVSAHSHSTVAAGNSAAVVCGTTILNLAASDQVSIVVENHTAARDIMVHHAQLSILYAGSP